MAAEWVSRGRAIQRVRSHGATCRQSPPPLTSPAACTRTTLCFHRPRSQHPARKLRQLESVAGRALLAGVGGKDGTPAALHCVTLAACDVAGGAWQVLYRSEAVSQQLGGRHACVLCLIPIAFWE